MHGTARAHTQAANCLLHSFGFYFSFLGVEPRDGGQAVLRGDRRRGRSAEGHRQRATRALHFGGDAGEAGAGGVQPETCQARWVRVERHGASGQVC